MLQAIDLAGLVSLFRPSLAWDFDAAGVLQEFGQHVPRAGADPVDAAARGLLVELAGGNSIRNPRCEGATPGIWQAGGAMPTNWGFSGTAGLTHEILGAGVEDGIPYVDIRHSGIPSINNFRVFPEVGNTAVVDGDTWTAGIYLRHLSGALPGLPTQWRMTLPDEVGLTVTPTGAPLRTQRFVRTKTMAGSGGIGRAELRLGLNPGETYDFTIRYGLPTLEKSPLVTSPVLPPVGAPAVSTEAADMPRIDGANFASIFGAGAPQGAVFVEGYMSASLATSAGRMFAQIDDGTPSNRVHIRTNSVGANWLIVAVAGGSSSALGTSGTAIYGAPFCAGLRWNGLGGFSGCMNGGTIAEKTGAPVGGVFTALRLGVDQSGGTGLQGRLRRLRALPYFPADAEFQARCIVGAS